MRSSSAGTPFTAQYACEICRERKVRCDRALPKCRRCDRLNQPCSYNQAHQRRTRDEQLKQLQERLAKTEAQLAMNTTAAPLSVRSQSRSEGTELASSTRWIGTPDSFTPNSCSRRSSQYQLPTTSTSQSQLGSVLGTTAANTPMDLDNIRGMSATSGMSTNGSSLFDSDLFTSFTEGADSNMTFAWTNQPLMALEPLDNMLLNRPQSAPPNGSEEDLSPTDLSLLHNHYFESVYFSFPFINRDRFTAEKTGSRSPATTALVYAVALAGCTRSLQDHNRQSTCYGLARNYAERCEQEDHLNDLNFLQALLLIGRFEAMNRKLERSGLTLGRAAMLCKLLKLHQMDKSEHSQGMQNRETQSGPRLALPHTKDPVLLEERRRTFWGLYILQSYVRTRTGWEFQLEDTKNLQINLPSPGLLRSDLEPLKMPSLLNISTEPAPEITSYAGCVLMVELALRCFDNGQKRDTPGFWDDYCALVKKTDDLFKTLKRHLNATSIREDPVAFSLYLNLRATEIFSHDSAITKNEEQGLPPLMVAESQRRATTAAFQICSAVGLNLPSPWKADSDIIMLQAIFIAWPLTMALKALYRELVRGGIRETVNGVVASIRLLFAALDHIEESDGHWHQCVTNVEAKLQEWDEKNSFDSLAL
uniref:Depudecin biosynthesis cluster-specific transcription activator DEP6 n=1 Tax=Alternaria brassicicola TaxID=29001 RepID=DEP6_ALTBR|nr:RecName: Full=Depudecin biosynthesis cluster-specific transcription activator DEP6; AltName: Full=Depudecin biosynthesis cluster protein 6 [Alternaria brassicicola]ACZ57549.1 predicted transcription factor [Alternaria brassicicola]